MRQRLQRTLRWRDGGIASRMAALAILLTSLAATADDDAVACGTSADEVRIQVSVTGMHSTDGNITITLYPNDPKRFMSSGGKLSRQRVPTTQPTTTACFVVAKAGKYAISIYHDENNDHKFKRTLIGLPDEGYGFSNNPKTLVGLPSLDEVRFPAQAGDNAVAIKLVY